MAVVSQQKEIVEDNIHKGYGPKATLAQVFATLAQSFLLVGLGMELSMPTIVIHALYPKSDNGFSLTLSDTSWYGSILFVFHPTISFLSGFLQERYGRKQCMIFANVPAIFGWILLYRADSIAMLYASTVLMGLSIGFSEAPILSYVGEITEPRLRGSMSSLACMTAWTGGLITFILGYLFDWRTVALLSASCPAICICLVYFIPESPVWLIAKGKDEMAIKSLCWLRGWTKPEAIKVEHFELVQYNQVSGAKGESDATGNKTFISKLREFKDPAVYRPLRLVMIFFFISNIVSMSPCKPYYSKIMTEVGISADDIQLLLVAISVLQCTGCATVVFTVPYLGKRHLSMLSILLSTILLCSFTVYVIASKNGYFEPTEYYWIPMTMMCCICYFGAIIASIPWMLLGEIFSNKSRGMATGSSAALAYLLMFVLTKMYLSVELVLGLGYTMALFSGVAVFGLTFVYNCLPETESRTLLEVEKYFVPGPEDPRAAGDGREVDRPASA